MSDLQTVITGWLVLRQQRQALLDVLGKADDRLLRDAGLTREEAMRLVKQSAMAWVIGHRTAAPSSRQQNDLASVDVEGRSNFCSGY
ncbi:hypothetical protein [Phyllobacterium sp. YR531]|uniref:hypothetical protein n=1 Tax=Phyllobacterium sp. YR531 TaxID=1144343 RepID=UPI00026FA1E6|nr:hypothetical protein [Phyllobacterium sp. YR531]EJM99311.1 hypothetical protein PMI41_04213 [Phyllobacterium sp. YR531]